MKVSVVIPVYNVENYIDRCINSVLNQTYVDYEIILVDDGSTDSSGKICDVYTNRLEKVSVIHQQNKGLASARKVGLDKAKGEYITFIDSDDYVHPEYLSILVREIKGCDIVKCSFTYGNKSDGFSKDTTETYEITDYIGPEIAENVFKKRILSTSACGMLVHKSMYNEIDMCEGAVPGEEICTTLQLYSKDGVRLRLVEKELYYYWQNQEGISRGGYTHRHKKGLENYIYYCGVFSDINKDIKEDVISYFVEHEMAIATAMSRNKTYDIDVITMLREHIKSVLLDIMKSKTMPLYYKASIILYLVNYRLFAVVFRKIRHFVGK